MIEGSQFTIRQMAIPDWKRYKAIRLNSLQDSPDAFGATYEVEAAFSDTRWQSRLASHVNDKVVLTLIAEAEGESLGIAGGVIFPEGELDALRPGSAIKIQPMVKKI